jgi:hypothetical protein
MRFVFAFIISTLSFSLHAQDLNEYKKEIFTGKDQYLPYRILFPLAFDTSKKYPLLVFLHGAYEKGNDNEAQLDIGGRYFLADSNRRYFPALCPSELSLAHNSSGNRHASPANANCALRTLRRMLLHKAVALQDVQQSL